MFRLAQRVRAASNPRARASRRPHRLHIEPLEDRRLLAQGGLLGSLVPNVTYHGGPLLQNVQIQSVYDGTAWTSDPNLQQQVQQTDGFLKYFVGSPYMDLLQQYNVGHGSFTGHDLVAQDPTGQTLDDSQIRSLLNSEISAGHVAAPNANSLYVFFTAPGVVVTAGGQNSVRNFAGYHDVFTDTAGAPVYYAVVPYPTTGQALSASQQTTVVLSHEVSEAVTDPDTQTGWFDPRRGEIGDLAEGLTGQLNGYTVQAVWSQSAGRAVLPSDSGSTGGTTGGTTAPSTVRVHGTNIEATAGQSITATVATITGADPSATTSSFPATIDWGNGTTGPGTVVADPNGGFDVTGTTTYSQAGWYPVTVTVHNASGGTVGVARSRASVAPAPPTVQAHGTQIQATAGQQFSGTVATFTDVNPIATAANFTATIDWGDGTTSDGTISVDSKGGFDVTGTHTYAKGSQQGLSLGSYSLGVHGNFFLVVVTIHDTAADFTATALSLAHVAQAPPDVTANGRNIQATSSQAFTGVVATFTTTNTTATAGTFKATIDWGDGSTSDGTITAHTTNGGFDVTGTHTYNTTSGGDSLLFNLGSLFVQGTRHFVVRVTITDTQTQDQAHTQGVATVLPVPPSLAVTAQNIQATFGQQFSGVVATITSTTAGATAAGFTATIYWGDGTHSAGTLTANSSGGFDVTGTHTYTDEGDNGSLLGGFGPGFEPGVPTVGPDTDHFRLSITVRSTATADRATAQAVASVTPPAAAVQATGTLINAVVGQEFSGTVATFTAQDATATAGTFTAMIDWGDGNTSAGAIASDGHGGFVVTGSHTYADPGASDVGGELTLNPLVPIHGPGRESFVITVTIQDQADNSTATALSLANVTPTPPKITVTGQTLTATAGQQLSGTVATFTDADGDGAGNFHATIDWGDGTRSAGTVAAGTSGFMVSGTHTYKFGGTYAVFISIRDQDGDSAVGFDTAHVADGTMSAALPTVSQALVQSFEHLANLVIHDYQQFLSRLPAQAEVNAWVQAMQGGATDEQVLSTFISSPEYYQHAGNTDKGWVDAMYQDLLGRTADTWGEGVWLQALAGGAKRTDIAGGIATSPEHEGTVVQQDYQQYLGRSAAASEVAGWVNAFGSGASNEQIIAGFLGSREYFDMHNANARDWLFSAYQNLLARQPDQAGLIGWLSVLGQNSQ
jgi:hypothetical protein